MLSEDLQPLVERYLVRRHSFLPQVVEEADMKQQVATLALIVLSCRWGTVFGMAMTDWWGPAPIDIGIEVFSAVTNEAISGAVITIGSLDEPRARSYTNALPSEAVTDDTGTAVLKVEFDGDGPTRDEGTWTLRGTLEIESEGYQTFSGLLPDCIGRAKYPMTTEVIYLTVLLDPEGGGECRNPDPVVFDPYTSVYTFAGSRHDRNSLVESITAYNPEDNELQRLVDEYRREGLSAKVFRWSGVLLAIGGSVAAGYYSDLNSADESPQADTGAYILSVGAAITGAILFLGNLHKPGEPTDVVDYYNARHRYWGNTR